ncbi:glycoside hydrolase family 3 protein [Thermothelomyces thermophilus ATCC 42464]|uniref:Glycoside hydrolase family 3 protein n=1 Tax=Thermothelomyces thermophilus (strain ATCC 42464 / BCRC 31852 / DSM 1799) TaxID=573729 RepID=G2QK46_THET4|nr:glycoside hydrolase family 3 protein [Thermothelomyces thermophilus ATCC 42464]AEO59952.1 glycoside hydrolase family 3 protein [Thermothelomyces thermophilus ATCC 42464]
MYILNEQETYRGSVDVHADRRPECACENEWTSNYLLKNELGSPGFIMSDWGPGHPFAVPTSNWNATMQQLGDHGSGKDCLCGL